MHFNYHIPTNIIFGAGELDRLGEITLPGKKALIVLSEGASMKRFGYLDRVVELLKKNGVEAVIFDRILPNPIRAHVMEGAELARNEKCDFIIGLGGGSSIDSAKSIAVMVKNGGDYWDYVHGGSGKGKPVTKKVLPIVAITTTAGTGTEADPWTVISHEEHAEKIGFGIKETFPTISIVDPELMTTVPRQLTAFQGFDAFFHAAEGVLASTATPVSDVFALKSIELITKYLPVAVENGSDLEARTQVALANTLAGLVESTSSCTSEHSMEHALSAVHPDLPHGAGLIMLSEAYFSFFQDKAPDKLISIAKAMGADISSVPEKEQAGLMLKQLRKLKEACGVDTLKMSDYGISMDDIPGLAKIARETMGGLFSVDPVPVNHANTIKIMSAAWK